MLKDVQGKAFELGQKVARASKYFSTDGLHIVIAEVTKIDGDKLYLDNSKQPIKYPERLAIMG